MTSMILRAVVSLFLTIACAASAAAQPSPQDVKVATRVLPPLVIQQDPTTLTGFSIDLWNEIAKRLQLQTRYEVAPDVADLFEMVRSGAADVGIAGLSITAAREAQFDFSLPMFSSGLQIMVRGKSADETTNPLAEVLDLLLSKTMLVWLGVALVLILVPAHLVWFFERHHPEGIVRDRRYFPGIFQGMFWAASTLATQGDQMPRQWLARAVAVLWMFTGVVFVAFYTAQLSASLTVQRIQGSINGPEDLSGKRVATTAGSTAAAALRDLRAETLEVLRIEDAYQALTDGKVDAVVFDSPVLLYYAANQGNGRVHIVGAPFRKEDYGIALRENSPLRKRVNGALLALREDGTYQRLYDKWFTTK